MAKFPRLPAEACSCPPAHPVVFARHLRPSQKRRQDIGTLVLRATTNVRMPLTVATSTVLSQLSHPGTVAFASQSLKGKGKLPESHSRTTGAQNALKRQRNSRRGLIFDGEKATTLEKGSMASVRSVGSTHHHRGDLNENTQPLALGAAIRRVRSSTTRRQARLPSQSCGPWLEPGTVHRSVTSLTPLFLCGAGSTHLP